MDNKEQNEQVHEGVSEHEVRLHKVGEIQKKELEPWAAQRDVPNTCAQVRNEQTESPDDREYTIAGRLMSVREHGKTIFCNLKDFSGSLQIYIKQDLVGKEAFEIFKDLIDIGDIIWCKGTAFVTKMGELTLKVTDVALLAKCLHPLPEKFHGLSDIEIKYRQRYLDLMTNQETMERFKKRSLIIRLLRNFLDDRGYWEVETPMLQPIPGGAAARPFVTHHNALDMELFMRIAPELYLKRLVVGGMERVYEINRNFRNEGISTRHNPEFTMLEFYTAHKDYHYIMDFVEQMFQEIAKKVCGTLEVPFGKTIVNFGNFRRLSPYQAVVEFGGLTEEQLKPENIDVTCKEKGVDLEWDDASYDQKVFSLFEECAEANIVDPVFIVDFPIELSPLAKRDPKKPRVAARFELFVAGMELSNGFNELNDPIDQAERFLEQVKVRERGDDEAMYYDADFVTALEYGLPPTVGVGIGIDRLVMLLTNTTSIKDVILFPTMKRKSE